MSKRILLVEDSKTQAEVLSRHLTEAGYSVVTAETGEEGLARWQDSSVDLVITDIVMPGALDGYDLCRRIKDADDTDTPVVLLTSLSDPLDIIKGLECSADNFLTKPYDPKHLLRRLSWLLTTREMRRKGSLGLGIKVHFLGREFVIDSDREQILDLLITSFEEAVRHNQELKQRESELEDARAQLSRYARSLEARLQSVLSSVPDVLFSLSPDCRETYYVSPGSRRVFGCEPDRFSFDFWRERTHPEDRERVARTMQRAVEEKRALTVEHRLLPNGSVSRWLSVTVVPVENAGTRVKQIDGIARDISERMQAHAAVRVSEERYRSLVVATSQMVWLTDADGLISQPSSSWQAFTGQTPEEFLGTGWADALHPGDREETLSVWRRAVESHSTFETEYRVRRHDGIYRHFAARAVPILDEDGSVREWVGVCNDITERKLADEAIRRHALFLELLQLVTAAANEAESLESALQITVDEVCHRTGWSVGHVFLANGETEGLESTGIWFLEDDPELEGFRDLTESIEFGEGEGMPGRVVARGGPEWIVDLANDPNYVRIEPDRTFGLASGFAVPVLVGKETVAVLEFYHRERGERDDVFLDIMVQIGTQLGRVIERQRAVRERELSERRVQQAQKMEALGRLAGGVAHDFNNLLTVIMGEAELALMDLDSDDSMYEVVQQIRAAGERAGGLTRQLLAFSRSQVSEPVILNLIDVVNDIEKMLTRLIGEDVELITRTPSEVYPVKADRGQLEQVLVNLVVNARDATPSGGKIVIQVENVTLDEAYTGMYEGLLPGEYSLMAVSDTGEGMTDEVKAHLFEPFFTTKSSEKGTGLGLATSYGIVKQNGGHIEVYSESGLGTTMKVFLPSVEKGAIDATVKTDEPLPTGDELILLVEDEDEVRATGAKILQSLGYEVIDAPDGEEALRAVEEWGDRLDLLITDVVLPKMNGRQIAERASRLLPHLRVLFASGYTDDVVLESRLLERMDTFLQKPFTPSTLARKARDALASKPYAQAGDA